MKRMRRLAVLSLLWAAVATVAGCGTTGSTPTLSPTPAATSASNTVGKPAAATDSSTVDVGSSVKVKGLGDWEGEISGQPGPGSKFTKLQIGMGMKQAIDIAGQPTDQGGYSTGRMWIPLFFGADKYRHEMVYKGQGRLIFASPGGFDVSSGNLIRIIHNPNEPGYR